jgi:hypothetical protein
MKKDAVPQDESSLSKKNIKELCYAVDEAGNYTTVLSQGWKPKALAMELSLQDIQERAEQAKEGIRNGTLSPIAYFMEINKMDLNILAGYMGMWRWRVKRHLKPRVFRKLSTRILTKYAEVFQISVTTLKNYTGES